MNVRIYPQEVRGKTETGYHIVLLGLEEGRVLN